MATTPPASGGNFLTSKVGPLPVWGWLAAAAVIYFFFLRKKTTATTSTTGTTTVAPTPTATITYPTGGSYTGPVGGAAPPIQGGGGGGAATPGGTGSTTPGGGATGPGQGLAGVYQTAPSQATQSAGGAYYQPVQTYQQTLTDFSQGVPVYFWTSQTNQPAPVTQQQFVATEHGGTHKYPQYTSYTKAA